MKQWILYDKKTTYYDEKGNFLSPEILFNIYPQSRFEDTVLLVDGYTFYDYKTIAIAITEYSIEAQKTVDKTVEMLNVVYYSKETESSSIDRIASSLEYIVVLLSKISEGINELSKNKEEL